MGTFFAGVFESPVFFAPAATFRPPAFFALAPAFGPRVFLTARNALLTGRALREGLVGFAMMRCLLQVFARDKARLAMRCKPGLYPHAGARSAGQNAGGTAQAPVKARLPPREGRHEFGSKWVKPDSKSSSPNCWSARESLLDLTIDALKIQTDPCDRRCVLVAVSWAAASWEENAVLCCCC